MGVEEEPAALLGLEPAARCRVAGIGSCLVAGALPEDVSGQWSRSVKAMPPRTTYRWWARCPLSRKQACVSARERAGRWRSSPASRAANISVSPHRPGARSESAAGGHPDYRHRRGIRSGPGCGRFPRAPPPGPGAGLGRGAATGPARGPRSSPGGGCRAGCGAPDRGSPTAARSAVRRPGGRRPAGWSRLPSAAAPGAGPW